MPFVASTFTKSANFKTFPKLRTTLYSFKEVIITIGWPNMSTTVGCWCNVATTVGCWCLAFLRCTITILLLANILIFLSSILVFVGWIPNFGVVSSKSESPFKKMPWFLVHLPCRVSFAPRRPLPESHQAVPCRERKGQIPVAAGLVCAGLVKWALFMRSVWWHVFAC